MPDPISTAETAQLVEAAGILLPAMAYLLVKHLFADFIFQSARQMREKGIYGAPGGLIHAAIHVALTAPVLLLLPTIGITAALAILAAEFVLHYHIDWGKEQIVRRSGWQTGDDAFWWALGIDQMLHGLTYVSIIWLILASA